MNEEKQSRVEAAIRRKTMRRIFYTALAVFIVGGGIWVGVWYSGRYSRSLPGQFFSDEGQEHVALDYQFIYNSNPPSSGPHYGSPADWGVYDYEVNDKIFIHNLEHGGVWISYRPDVESRVIEHLKSIVEEFGGSKIVMAPRSANDSDIAVAAWTRVLKFDLGNQDISEEQLNQIRAFYKTYRNRGPEFVPDTMPGVDPKSVQ